MTGLDTHPVQIADGPDVVDGDLTIPDAATGLVVFAHGSGSSRHSGRNKSVAAVLNDAGMATLLMDLLTAAEEAVDLRTREHRFDIALLGRRLVAAVDWAATDDRCRDLALGCFGASTGAAAALIAAAQRAGAVRAVVSRGGRPDLAGDALGAVRCPTLLIVGGEDHVVLDLNREAAARLTAPTTTEVVPGATHLFEEPGALDQVAALAADWFTRHLLAG